MPVSDFDDGDLRWLKAVADGAMDNLLSVGRAERTLLHIAELEADLERFAEGPYIVTNSPQMVKDMIDAGAVTDGMVVVIQSKLKEVGK